MEKYKKRFLYFYRKIFMDFILLFYSLEIPMQQLEELRNWNRD